MGASPSSARGPKQVIELTVPVKVDRHRVFVNPPAPRLGTAALVQWVNNTGGTAKLWFPHGDDIFDAAKSKVDFSNPIVIPAGEASPELVVKAGQPNSSSPVHYRYSVFCDAVREFAQGNSEPQIDVP